MVEEYSNSLPKKDVAEETAINKNEKIIKAEIISPDADYNLILFSGLLFLLSKLIAIFLNLT